MKLDAEILIVGGGLNGPVLALALAQVRQFLASPVAIRRTNLFAGALLVAVGLVILVI
jgi:hypothetical protein